MRGTIRFRRRGSAESLFDNGWFLPQYLVNQRGQTSYTMRWGMTIDRWYFGDSVDNTSTMTLTDAGITLTSSGSGLAVIQQRIARIDTSQDHTYAWCDSHGKITASIVTADWIKSEVERYGFMPVSLYVPNGTTLRWVALYEDCYTADTVPKPIPHLYSAELAECRRWYLGLDETKWYEATRPLGDIVRFEVLGSFYRTPTLIGTPRVYLKDGWHNLTQNWIDTLPDRIIYRFDIPDNDLMPIGGTYLLSGVSGVSCEL